MFPTVLAHGVGGRSDLPVPEWQAAWGAAVALVLSFAALGLLWHHPRLRSMSAGLRVGSSVEGAVRFLVGVFRAVVLVVFLVVLAAPVVISETWRQLRAGRLQPPVPHRVLAVVLCLALCALPLYLALGSAPDLAGLSTEVMRRIPGQGGSPVPTEHAWSFLHGSGPAWPFLAEPGSTSSN